MNETLITAEGYETMIRAMQIFLTCLILMVSHHTIAAETGPVPKLCSDASILNDRDDYRLSVTVCGDYVEKFPNDANAHFLLGLAYLRNRSSISALKSLSRSVELEPVNPEAHYLLGDNRPRVKYDEPINDFTTAIKQDPNYEMAYVKRGILLRGIEKYDDALSDFNKAISINPINAKSYNYRANVFGHLEKKKKALKDYSKAIELDPAFTIAWSNRGNVHLALGNFSQALSDQNAALKISPDDDSTYNNRAKVYRALGRYEEALADHSMALKLERKFSEKHDLWLGYARYKLEEGLTHKAADDKVKARESLEEAAKLGDKKAKEELKSF